MLQLPVDNAEIPRDDSNSAPCAITSKQRQHEAGFIIDILPEASANKETLKISAAMIIKPVLFDPENSAAPEEAHDLMEVQASTADERTLLRAPQI
jgi:hypothetical protein